MLSLALYQRLCVVLIKLMVCVYECFPEYVYVFPWVGNCAYAALVTLEWKKYFIHTFMVFYSLHSLTLTLTLSLSLSLSLSLAHTQTPMYIHVHTQYKANQFEQELELSSPLPPISPLSPLLGQSMGTPGSMTDSSGYPSLDWDNSSIISTGMPPAGWPPSGSTGDMSSLDSYSSFGTLDGE